MDEVWAISLRERALRACDRSAGLRTRSSVLISEARASRCEATPRWFRVAGTVDGQPGRVLWWRGRMSCSDELRARAEVIVGMGDTFESESHEVAASFDQPVAALLTFVRAFDHVRAVEMSRA